MTTPRELRRAAVESCMARFGGKALDWKSRDCVRLIRHGVHHLGVSVPILKGVNWTTRAGAIRALKKAGYDDLQEAMAATGFIPIAPAMTWPADILVMPGEPDGPFRFSLSLVHTHGAARSIGFGHDGVCAVGTPDLSVPGIKAWRVPVWRQ